MLTLGLSRKFQSRHQLKNAKYLLLGSRSKDLSTINKPLYENVSKKIISLFHNSEHDYMGWTIATSFQSVTEEYGCGVIHTDHNTVFAAVLYLTPDTLWIQGPLYLNLIKVLIKKNIIGI